MNVLLVEDNAADARLILELLKESPDGAFHLHQAERLELALRRLRHESFDVVLLDLGLSDSQGIETLKLTLNATNALPIVVLTGLNDERMAFEAVRAGAQDYLVKGRFDGQLLGRTIRHAIERKRAAEQIRQLNLDLEQRVAERTAQLQIANASLLKEVIERQRVEETVRASEERYRSAFQTSIDAITISRLGDGRYVDVNHAFLEITGFERQEVIGQKWSQLGLWVNHHDRENLLKALSEKTSCRNCEAQFKRKNGDLFWGIISASTFELEGELCVLSVLRDISAAKEFEEEIKELAFFDPLTKLANRRLLMERLGKSIAFSARNHRKRALLFLDLDNFKTLNDTLGHHTGDLLLQKVAERLTACIREVDTVSRFGGDEFVLILEDLSEHVPDAVAQAKAIAEKVLTRFEHPYHLDEHECISTCSIGITIFGDQNEKAHELLQQADIALYQAKAAGRNAMCFFAHELQAEINRRAEMEDDLRQAIKAGQFLLHYQPQFENDRLIGAEALVRWNHPRLGLLSAGAFIPLAEETRLIFPLGKWVLDSACRQIAAWASRKETASIVVAVNISVLQLLKQDFVDSVLNAIEQAGANPENLKLELTESMLVKNAEDVIAKMTVLKSHGVSFSVDDFGTGYSSLAYLKRLPLDQLKIDQSFVRDIVAESSSSVIARSIISLSEAMGMSVIAEGVETKEQLSTLANLGCHSYQGYLLGRPQPLEQFELAVTGSFSLPQ